MVAMLRHANRLGRTDLLKLAVSARTMSELPYADELVAAQTFIALTREDTAAGRVAGRLTTPDVGPVITPDATYFVCGSAGLVQSMQ